MTEKIISGISARIKEAFGESCIVHTEQPEPGAQGVPGPCFFAALKKSSQKKLGGKRSLRNNLFDIQYYPNRADGFHGEADSVSQVLYEKLELLHTEVGLLTGTGMNCEKAENILHFYVEYDVLLLEEKEQEIPMEVLSVSTGLRKE